MSQSQTQFSQGKLVVILLVLLGVLAGIISVYYWTTQVVGVQSQNGQSDGGKPRTPQEIEKEYEDLSLGVTEAMGGGKGLSEAVVARVVAFVEAHSDHAGGYRLLGQVLLEHNARRAEAYESWKKSLQLDDKQPELLINTGTLALELLGQLEKKAIPDEVLKDPVKRKKWTVRQEMQRDQWLKEAESHYVKAVKQDPSNPRYYFFLGSLYMKQKRHDEAMEVLRQAIELDATLFAAHFQMSQIFVEQENYVRALESLTLAIEHVPDSKRPLQVLYLLEKARILIIDERPEDALNVIEALTIAERDDHKAVEIQIKCYELLGKPQLAARIWERQMKLDRRDPKPAVEAAKWRLKAGQFDLAREHVRSLKVRSKLHPQIEQLNKQIDEAEKAS